MKKIKQKKSAQNVKPKSILEAFESIVELAEGSNLDTDFYDKASACIKYASRKLKLTATQCVLLAMFVDHSEDYSIMISEIAEQVGCRTTKILRLLDDIDVLEAKHYLRASRSIEGSLSYRVPGAVLNALRQNTEYIYKPLRVIDTQTFFERFDTLMN